MKNSLLEIIRCPRCRNSLSLSAQKESNGAVLVGTLTCAPCAADYPIRDGVPRMIPSTSDTLLPTKRGFEYQWFERIHGKHEPRSQCYGFPTPAFIDWLVHQFGLSQSCAGKRWILDAGCGSAEKVAELARRFPQNEVVGLDLSDTLALSRKENESIPNLHFVQGDVNSPPFNRGMFDQVVSIGVLHHTENTQKAFNGVAELLAPGGGMLLFIYPAMGEDRFWTSLYRQRDRLFFGQGHRLPRGLLMAFCRIYMGAFLLPAWLSVHQQAAARHDEFPFAPRRQGLLDFYHAGVFLMFDNMMPPFQHRHARAEVIGWFQDSGFERIDSRYSGFYAARRT